MSKIYTILATNTNYTLQNLSGTVLNFFNTESTLKLDVDSNILSFDNIFLHNSKLYEDLYNDNVILSGITNEYNMPLIYSNLKNIKENSNSYNILNNVNLLSDNYVTTDSSFNKILSFVNNRKNWDSLDPVQTALVDSDGNTFASAKLLTDRFIYILVKIISR